MSTRVSRRTMLKWMAISATGAVVSACVAAPGQAPTGGAAPAQAGVEIGWARHGSDDDLVTENGLAKLFADKHPGITIKPLVLPWDDYNTKIPVMVAGGNAPDTFGCHPALLGETYAAKGLIPVNDYIDSAGPSLDYKDVLYQGNALFEGKIVGLPQKSCTHQMRYNKKLFEEAGLPTPGELYWSKGKDGWNWNTFVEMGRKLTKDTDGDGKADQYLYAQQDGTSILSWIRSAGGEVFNADETTCTLTSDKAKEALQFMADLVLKDKVQPPPEMGAADLGINFRTGKIAMEGATTCDSVRDLRKGQELPFAWDYVLQPAGSAGFRAWGDTDQIIISSASKHAKEAFDWMGYRSSKEAWEDGYAHGIILAFSDGPTRWSIFDSKAYTEPLTGIDLKMIREGYTNTIPDPYVPRVPQPYRILFTIMPTEVDNVLRGVKNVNQAADDMCAQITAVLKEGAPKSFSVPADCTCKA